MKRSCEVSRSGLEIAMLGFFHFSHAKNEMCQGGRAKPTVSPQLWLTTQNIFFFSLTLLPKHQLASSSIHLFDTSSIAYYKSMHRYVMVWLSQGRYSDDRSLIQDTECVCIRYVHDITNGGTHCTRALHWYYRYLATSSSRSDAAPFLYTRVFRTNLYHQSANDHLSLSAAAANLLQSSASRTRPSPFPSFSVRQKSCFKTCSYPILS